MFINLDDTDVINNITFWGCNIPNELRQVIESTYESTDASFENDDQRKAYHLGVENTLSLLKQLLDEDNKNNSVTFYYPKTETAEEMSIEEIIEWLKTL